MAATYILGPFRLDAETDTLFRGGEPDSLGHRAVALLRVLVDGIPVSKDALMDAAWAGLTDARCTAGFQPCLCLLMGWSGRAPAPPAIKTGKGRQRRGARHVTQAEYSSSRRAGIVTGSSRGSKQPRSGA
jgi:hypothetical protein